MGCFVTGGEGRVNYIYGRYLTLREGGIEVQMDYIEVFSKTRNLVVGFKYILGRFTLNGYIGQRPLEFGSK